MDGHNPVECACPPAGPPTHLPADLRTRPTACALPGCPPGCPLPVCPPACSPPAARPHETGLGQKEERTHARASRHTCICALAHMQAAEVRRKQEEQEEAAKKNAEAALKKAHQACIHRNTCMRIFRES